MPDTLAIVTQDPLNRGGVLRLAEYLYRRAEAIGIRPTLVHYGSFKGWPKLSVSLVNSAHGRFPVRAAAEEYTFEGMRAIAIGAYFPEWEPLRVASNSVWTETLAKFDGVILATGSAHTGYPLVQQSKPFAAWVSSTVLDDRGERLRTPKGLTMRVERLGLRRVELAETRVLENAKCVLAVSKSAAISLRERLPNRNVEVWPYPVDTDRFAPSKDGPRERRLLFVGRAHDPRKRIQLFFEAAEIVLAMPKMSDVRFGVVSGAPIPAEVASRFSAVMSQVDLYSSLTDAVLIELYVKSSALIVSSEQEGLCIAAMEAMSCGRPVISTHCGGPEMLIEDGVSGYFADTPQAIAECAAKILQHPNIEKKIGRAAREAMVEQFSERKWNPKFEKLLREATRA